MSSLTQNVPDTISVSYDISCLWSKYLAWRAETIYPPNMVRYVNLSYLVPKFHIAAHVPICQITYSHNYTPRVGRGNGEAPERGWEAVNAVAKSTKEMGPGARVDTLDDHFGDYNWRKITGLGKFPYLGSTFSWLTLSLTAEMFLRKMIEAVDERSHHVLAFQDFDAALPEEDTKLWTKSVQAWEADPTQPNPFQTTLRGKSHCSKLARTLTDSR